MDLAGLRHEEYCYLTTTGRVTGRAHRIEIWFVVVDGAVWLLAGGGRQADWVANIAAEPAVTLEIAGREAAARARIADGPDDAADGRVAAARRAMVAKYTPGQPAGSLDRWGAEALPVEVRLAA